MNLQENLTPDHALPPSQQSAIKAEKLRLLYENIPLVMLGGTVASLTIVLALWDTTRSKSLLLGWFLAVSAWNSYAIYGYYRLLRNKYLSPDTIISLGERYPPGAFLAGVIWGIGSILFFDGSNFQSQIILIVVSSLVAAGTVTSHAIYFAALPAFILPMLLPLALMAAVQGDTLHLAMAMAILFFIACCLFFGKNLSKLVHKSIQLRLINEKLAEDLSQANLAKTRFLAAASHDLRQPMHTIGILVGALRERIKYPEVKSIVDKVEASVEAMDSLFNTLLDISKLDAGALVTSIAEFPVQAVLDQIEVHYAPQAHAKGLKFRVVKCNAIVRSDPDLLDRIVRNLVSNAIRYTDSGSILIGCRKRGALLVIQVSDTGVGIPPNQTEQIFYEFVQLSNSTRDRSKGLGLGLSIVHRLAKLLGHDICVTSQPGKGSTFTVTVPIVLGKKMMRSVAKIVGPNTKIGGKFIVVVDDEEDILFSMESLLKLLGCHVVCARSAEDAVEKLSEHLRSPDLIATDFRVGGNQTGIDVINMINESQGLKIPALIITGGLSPEDLLAVESSGYPVLYKPVSEKQLRNSLSEILSKLN